MAMFLFRVSVPGSRKPCVQTEAAVQLGKCLERLDAFRDDFWPNSVAWQNRDLIVVHGSSPCSSNEQRSRGILLLSFLIKSMTPAAMLSRAESVLQSLSYVAFLHRTRSLRLVLPMPKNFV